MKKKLKLKDDIRFCTECGKDLTNFDISGKSGKEIDLNFENCRRTGKFNGDLCSKKFIMDDDIAEKLPDDDDDF